jgi:hypothetical protein
MKVSEMKLRNRDQHTFNEGSILITTFNAYTGVSMMIHEGIKLQADRDGSENGVVMRLVTSNEAFKDSG